MDTASPAIKNAANESALDDSDSSRIGQAMHRLLQWGGTAGANVPAAAREFRLTSAQGEVAAVMARSILTGEGAWVFDRRLLDWQGDEVELLWDGRVLRLDRLVRRADNGEWWVLDYKSQGMPQDDPALVAQLRTYRDAVRAIYPATTVRAAFLAGDGRMVEPLLPS
jgi:ATP-dependent helicase/nuclease subunit A